MAVDWNEDDGDDGVVIALARFSDLRVVTSMLMVWRFWEPNPIRRTNGACSR